MGATPQHGIIIPSSMGDMSVFPERLAHMKHFLQANHFDSAATLLAKDMSNRTYFRLKVAHKTYVLMDAPHPENPKQFVYIAHLLQSKGLRSPLIVCSDFDHGFLILEDFGDQTFTRVLESHPHVELDLYYNATMVLKALQFDSKPEGLEDYTVQRFKEELETFTDWYWAFSKSGQMPRMIKEPFLNMWGDLFQAHVVGTPHTLMLRDYHVDNLMMLKKNLSISTCGLLDFQDAVWGPAMYDFVSLIEDARRTVSADVVEKGWAWFLKGIPFDQHSALRTTGSVLSAARHLKNIGVFTRYALRAHNESKLCHLPRLWGYIIDHFKNPLFQHVADWFHTHMPLDQQIKSAA
jgi:aminoglycoside/choline kinase family phosphotransferase